MQDDPIETLRTRLCKRIHGTDCRRSTGHEGRRRIISPQFFAYKYLHALQGDQIVTHDPEAMLAVKDGSVTALIWDFEQPDQKVSNRPFYTKEYPSHDAPPVELQLTHLPPGATYHLQIHRTGFHRNDAYSAYLEMGSPKILNAAQLTQLNELTRDLPERDEMVNSGADGTVRITLP